MATAFQRTAFQRRPAFQIDADVVVTPPEGGAAGAEGVGAFPGAWRKRKKVPKKELLSELDQLLIEVRDRIVPYNEARDKLEQDRMRAALQRGVELDLSDTYARIENEIMFIEELLAEADDEDAILLLH